MRTAVDQLERLYAGARTQLAARLNETTHHGAEIGCLRDLLRVLP